MNQMLEKVLAGTGTGAEPIRVDIDALWRKASEEGQKKPSKERFDPEGALDDMGEFAVISAWARGKGKGG